MNDNVVVNVGNTYISAMTRMPFSSMIGGPLKAAVEAQQLAADSSLQFIEKVCFVHEVDINNPEGEWVATDKMRYITFSYKEKSEDGTEKEFEIKVPLLSLVPIPFIRIEQINLSFTAKMEGASVSGTSRSSEKEKAGSNSFHISGGAFGVSAGVSLSSSYSSSHKSSAHSENKYNNEMTMDISVQAVNDDMPAGVKKVLQILENTMIPMEKKDLVEPDVAK